MTPVKYVLILLVMLGITYQILGTTEDSYRNLLGLNLPYGRGMVRKYKIPLLFSFNDANKYVKCVSRIMIYNLQDC